MEQDARVVPFISALCVLSFAALLPTFVRRDTQTDRETDTQTHRQKGQTPVHFNFLQLGAIFSLFILQLEQLSSSSNSTWIQIPTGSSELILWPEMRATHKPASQPETVCGCFSLAQSWPKLPIVCLPLNAAECCSMPADTCSRPRTLLPTRKGQSK